MRTLVIGSGGREHALALALHRDEGVSQVHAAPGNPGIAKFGQVHAVDPLDGDAVAGLAERIGADLVVVGPEAPLVHGVADAVRARGIAAFGASAAAARIEGSKAFAKDVMAAAGVPTGLCRVCDTAAQVEDALDAFGPPYVVKDDGLAAGKGVVVTPDRDAALGHAGHCGRVVVEEFLDGPEVSLFAITDGTTVLPLLPAQDFKRLGDGDVGPNTGGMGAYAPLPWAPAGLADEVVATVIQPVVDELRRRGTPFVGLVYAGLALTSRGIRVVEFNARFGDPETQPLLALLETPLAQVLLAAAQGRLAEIPALQWKPGAAVGVVLASPGYPAKARTGGEITGADGEDATAHVIHAGTSNDDGVLRSAGGRVLLTVGLGADLAAARRAAYDRLAGIHLDGGQARTDIALAAVEGRIQVPQASAVSA